MVTNKIQPTLGIRLTPATRTKLRQLAKDAGMVESQYVRKLIADHLKEKSK